MNLATPQVAIGDMKPKDDWYKNFFKNSFYNPASPLAVKRARDEVRFIIRALKLKKSSKILDLCCGPARHSIHLARKGFAVTGLDFSKDYILEAKKKAAKSNLKINFICGDMRNLKFNEKFDAVINLFTSFGYFQKLSEDIKVLKGIHKALKPGGLFLIDTLNGDWLRKNFRKRYWQKLENGTYLLEETKLAKNKKSTINKWIKIKPAEQFRQNCLPKPHHRQIGTGENPDAGWKIQERIFYLRLYDKKFLSSVFKKVGFTPLKFWGNFKGQKLSDKTNRLIALARKK